MWGKLAIAQTVAESMAKKKKPGTFFLRGNSNHNTAFKALSNAGFPDHQVEQLKM